MALVFQTDKFESEENQVPKRDLALSIERVKNLR
jgi:hypothetical protein